MPDSAPPSGNGNTVHISSCSGPWNWSMICSTRWHSGRHGQGGCPVDIDFDPHLMTLDDWFARHASNSGTSVSSGEATVTHWSILGQGSVQLAIRSADAAS